MKQVLVRETRAVGGSHALAEAVLAGTLTLLGLIGTFHLRDTSFKFLRLPECPLVGPMPRQSDAL